MSNKPPIKPTAEDLALFEGLQREGFEASLTKIPGCICIGNNENHSLLGDILITAVKEYEKGLGRWVLAFAPFTAITRSWSQVCEEIRRTSDFPNGLWIQNTEPDHLPPSLGFAIFVSADTNAAAMRPLILAVGGEARRALELLFARTSPAELFEAGIEAGRAAA